MPLFSWQRTIPASTLGENAFRGKSTAALEGERGEGNDAQFKLSWIILAISDLYGSENATVFPQPITTRFPPPDNGLFNAPPIYHSAKFYKRLSNLVALGFRSIASIFPTNNFNLIIVYWSSFNGKFARFIHLIIIGITTHKFKWDCYHQLVIYIKVSNSRFISHTFKFWLAET